MIVVSGVLVLVALVFLILGLFQDGLGFIWASIITSVVAGVFLLLGALQRRGTPATAADTGTTGSDSLERVTAVSVRSRDEATSGTEETADVEPADADVASGGEVSIVPGRLRYHTASCRFLAGRPDVETISVDTARGEGYAACGVCKPDQALAAASTEPPAAEETVESLDDTAAIDTAALEDAAPLAAPSRARKAPAKKAAAATKSTATRATRGTAGTAAAATETADAAADAGTTATKATKATKAAAKPAKATGTASVVAVPDRGKYHVETCRFANVPGALTMTKTAASRQGLAPCGVCKP